MSEQPPRPEDAAPWTAPGTGGRPPEAAYPPPSMPTAAPSAAPPYPPMAEPAYSLAASSPVEHRAGGLAIAALVLGIVGLVAAIIPFLCFLAFLPAVAAVVVGIVALVKRTTRRGLGITGLVLGAVGILVAFVMTIVSIFLIVGLAAAADGSSDGSSDGFDSGSPFGDDTDGDQSQPAGGPFADGYVITGSGEDIVAAGSVDGDDYLGLARITVTGGSYFEVYGQDAAGEDIEWVTDGSGDYTGNVVFNTIPGDAITAFHVTGDGDWRIELHSVDAVPSTTSATTGSGDDVLYYEGSATTAEVACTSGTAISVWSDSADTLLQGEECPYSGTVDLPTGGGLLQIIATGDWTFTPVEDVT